MIECLKCGRFCKGFYKLEKKYYKTHKMWDKLNELEGTTKENKE